MNTVESHLVIAHFPDETSAQTAYDEFVQKMVGKKPETAIIHRAADGALHVKEWPDHGGKHGAMVGGAIGTLIGLLAGPAGAIVGGLTGAWIGGVSAATTDFGIPDPTLDEIGLLLTPGTAVIVAMPASSLAAEVESALADAGGNITWPSASASGSAAEPTNPPEM